MRVLVAGSRGGVGRILIDRLVARGHEVAGMVRSDEQRTEVERAGAKAVLADLTQEDTLAAAAAGQDALIFAAGSKGKALDAIDRDGAIRLYDAAKNAGARRFVLLSSFYAGHPDEGPGKIRAYLQAKKQADDCLEASGLDYTIVRPGYLTNDDESGHITVSEYFDDLNASISRADVAEVLATALDAPGTIGRTFEVRSGSTPIRDALEDLGPQSSERSGR